MNTISATPRHLVSMVLTSKRAKDEVSGHQRRIADSKIDSRL